LMELQTVVDDRNKRKASPGPVPPGDYRRAPLAVYSAAVGSVTVPGWPMAAMAARCK